MKMSRDAAEFLSDLIWAKQAELRQEPGADLEFCTELARIAAQLEVMAG